MVRKETTDFEVLPGNGLKAEADGIRLAGGNSRFVSGLVSEISPMVNAEIDRLAGEGKTPVIFAKEDEVIGLIAVADTIKEDSAEAIAELKGMGIHTVMLTGDNEITAKAIARQAGVDEVVAGVLPDGKEAVIRKLMEHGKTAMVGDGINDAPALTRADIGIAIGAGTDIAIDAADIVLMKGSIRDVAAAIRISRATIRNIHENLFWAFFYNVIGIPLAAGCYVAAFGWELNPMFGAAAMGLSSFCVVSNALRLNLVKVYDSKHDRKIRNAVEGNVVVVEEGRERNFVAGNESVTDNKTVTGKEGNEMKIKVTGMMCGHCEAHVKKALEAIDGIKSAVASHEDNLVTIECEKDVDESLMKAAVEDAGYEYGGII